MRHSLSCGLQTQGVIRLHEPCQTDTNQGCGFVDDAPAAHRKAYRGQRCALPTALSFAHKLHSLQLRMIKRSFKAALQDTRRPRNRVNSIDPRRDAATSDGGCRMEIARYNRARRFRTGKLSVDCLERPLAQLLCNGLDAPERYAVVVLQRHPFSIDQCVGFDLVFQH